MTPGQLALVRPRRDCRCPRVRHQHGTEPAYSRDGCRCLPCRLARQTYCAAWRDGRDTPKTTLPAIGAQRRLRALATLGWSPPELAAVTGLAALHLMRLRNDRGDTTTLPATHAAICAAYDQLWDTRSDGVKRRRIANDAARKGWHGPLDWDDDEIDDPTAEPHTPTGASRWDLRPCGTDAAAKRHHRAGEPLDEACRQAANRISVERRARRRAQVRADLDALTA